MIWSRCWCRPCFCSVVSKRNASSGGCLQNLHSFFFFQQIAYIHEGVFEETCMCLVIPTSSLLNLLSSGLLLAFVIDDTAEPVEFGGCTACRRPVFSYSHGHMCVFNFSRCCGMLCYIMFVMKIHGGLVAVIMTVEDHTQNKSWIQQGSLYPYDCSVFIIIYWKLYDVITGSADHQALTVTVLDKCRLRNLKKLITFRYAFMSTMVLHTLYLCICCSWYDQWSLVIISVFFHSFIQCPTA